MIGLKFGKLTVVGFDHRDSKNAFWSCICECGKKTVAVQGQLKRGQRVSCGCTRNRKANIASGKERKTSTFISWQSMMLRCNNTNAPDYPRYGGRGITVCEAWKNSYEQFKKDMGERPIGKTLDRIDNNGNYCPCNCKWSTAKEQQNNKRSNVFHEVFGRRLSPEEIMKTYGITSKKFYYWIKKGRTAQEVILGQVPITKSVKRG